MKKIKGHKFNCDSTTGTMIEIKICANIELRRIDSIMLSKFNSLIDEIKTDNLIKNNDSLISFLSNNRFFGKPKEKVLVLIKPMDGKPILMELFTCKLWHSLPN